MIGIMGPASVPLWKIQNFALISAGTDWYRRAVVALYDAGLITGVDPVVLAAQCAHETNYGKFGGVIDETYGNTCGLKIRTATGDTPGDHARFALDQYGYPRLGALAHAHHLRLYAGLQVPPDSPDPRAVWLAPGSAGFGAATVVERLGTRWAPAADYGTKVAVIHAKIVAS